MMIETEDGWINVSQIHSAVQDEYYIVATDADGKTHKIAPHDWQRATEGPMIPAAPGYFRIHVPEGDLADEKHFANRSFDIAPIVGWIRNERHGLEPLTVEDFSGAQEVAVICPNGTVTTYECTFESLSDFEESEKRQWPRMREIRAQVKEQEERDAFAKELGLDAA